ncbi:hypothetical protein DPMN_042868 [Dreissena polymorpha]|uniref:Uncharacterized protein n=1 Tax=Dreissena polymorpha TaxID=45954 RepID=A0A9D4D0B6_DREPO|nr:hypothetical protein DPMN_042868 [Dreissena polymorpha]
MGCNGACTNAVMKPDGTSWRLCDGGGAGVCDLQRGVSRSTSKEHGGRCVTTYLTYVT